jgi:hypothetical protein
LVAIWNSLPGVTPSKAFENPKAAASKIWGRIQSMAEPEKPIDGAPKAERKPKGGAQGAKGAPKGKSSTKATPAKKSPKGAKAAKPAKAELGAPREGSKTAQVVAMLQRKNGATLSEIMEKMGWQRHTVRGFMAGTMKKAGYEVESFKPEGGERAHLPHQYEVASGPSLIRPPGTAVRLFSFRAAVVPHLQQPPSARTWANWCVTRATSVRLFHSMRSNCALGPLTETRWPFESICFSHRSFHP